MAPALPKYRTARQAFIEQYSSLPGLSSLKNDLVPTCHPADDHIWIAASYLNKMGMYLTNRDFQKDYDTAIGLWEATRGRSKLIIPGLAKTQALMLATSIMHATGGKSVMHAFFESTKWTSGKDLEKARSYGKELEEKKLRDQDYKNWAVDSVIKDEDEADFQAVQDQGAVKVGESGFSADNGQPLVTGVKARWNKLKLLVKK